MPGNKYISNNAGTLTEVAASQTSAGAGDANKIVALDATGRIDTSMMPVGVAADTQLIVASEALSAGDFVNIHNSTGAKARKADATTSGKEAHGFVLSAFSTAASATVYFEGTNTAVTGATPGVVYLATSAGTAASAAPTTAGNVVQRIGFATSATTINFQSQPPVVLA